MSNNPSLEEGIIRGVGAAHFDGRSMEDKKCKICDRALDINIRAGKHLMCRPCKSKKQVLHDKNNVERKRAYANEYARRIGRVKEYPCEICSRPCFKKYAKAFCSDKCRFLSHIDITNSCWLWKSAVNRGGYGKTCFRGNNHDTSHRVSYKLFKGPIPEEMWVLHTCDIPLCVNPSHLFLGTTQDNKKDQISKDRGGIKLKEVDVIEIRKMYEQGVGSQEIAYIYRVACSTISNIVKRRIWKHV